MKNMNKNSLFCLILVWVAVIFAFSGPVNAQDQKVRIGVVSFENSSKGVEADSDVFPGMADILYSELSRGNRNYEIVGRSQLDKAFAEISGGAGTFDEAASREIGKALRLDYVAIGNLLSATIGANNNVSIGSESRLGKLIGGAFTAGNKTANVRVEIKVIDVKSGKPVFSDVAVAEQEMGAAFGVGTDTETITMGSLELVARDAISKLANKIKKEVAPAEYTVLQIKGQAKGGEVVIDMGRDDGAILNRKLKIIREGDALTNPRTGEIVDREIIEIADIIITLVAENTSNAKIDKIYQGEIVDNKGKKKKVNRTIERGDIIRPIMPIMR